jgi:hypothetical protein
MRVNTHLCRYCRYCRQVCHHHNAVVCNAPACQAAKAKDKWTRSNKHRKKVLPPHCVICKGPKSKPQLKACSPDCLRALRRQRDRKLYATRLLPKHCGECNKWLGLRWPPRKGRPSRAFLCKPCRKETRAIENRMRTVLRRKKPAQGRGQEGGKNPGPGQGR